MKVCAKQCATCIYQHKDWVKELEAQVADPNMEGFFTGHRICHHQTNESNICCRGFWDRHKDSFTAGQISQRLGLTEFVEVE